LPAGGATKTRLSLAGTESAVEAGSDFRQDFVRERRGVDRNRHIDPAAHHLDVAVDVASRTEQHGLVQMVRAVGSAP
jgi:hypothetical protein